MTSGTPRETAVDTEAVARAIATEHGLTLHGPAGEGVDFVVCRVGHPALGEAVLRIPRHRVYLSPYGNVDSADLVRQEHEIAAHLGPLGLPVATPLRRIEQPDGLVVSLAAHVEHDDVPLDGRDVGRFLAALHGATPPSVRLAYQAPGDFATFFIQRLSDRHANLLLKAPALPPLPARHRIEAALEAVRAPHRLLHLDVRRQNLLGRQGRLAAVVDWSNALIGPPLMELARVAEYALLPDNGIDAEAVLAGYAESLPTPDLDSSAALLYRLDTAVMLALVFHSVAPDAERAHVLTSRAEHLLARLHAAVRPADTAGSSHEQGEQR
ncbi:aminoglycoside phosphotransferase family protein [Streptomyces sp. SH5]|uniref:phosphotransferase family protein n=1 Tax=Streptomyces sp. SH5 TaxID=3041765 RepID=UPI002477E4F8|nr:aminoglycoside phosphotransferase family protein [Streptomyces sp. SH5]WGP11357.1 aminoglycoside phosphotransferase family protein [Streptomyces sp. SH5]